MKYLSYLLVLTALLYSGCSHKARPKPILTKKSIKLENITAPRELGRYTLNSTKLYEDKTLGLALRYANNKQKNAFLDAFIYPKKLDKDLNSHYQDFLDALNYMKEKGEFLSLEKIKEDEVMLDSGTKAKRVVFKITNKLIPYYSVAYLADLGDKFFKVRISNRLDDKFLHSDLGWSAVRKLYTSIRASSK